MAVYTKLTKDDFRKLLADYDLGEAASWQGIEGGIENTNYFLVLKQNKQQHDYVLTLFEELDQDEIPYFIELCQWLSARDIPVPYAIKDRNGIALKKVKNRPAALQPRFYGKHVDKSELSAKHCTAIGKMIARFHLAAEDFYMKRQAHRGLFWWRRESELIAPQLSSENRLLLTDEVNRFNRLHEQAKQLPIGTIHGDLFHDNALFQGTEIDVILDLYNAATGYLLFDLAIIANDWCSLPNGEIDNLREQALLNAYASVRPFVAEEYTAWPVMLCTAAMRFWLSRLLPWLDKDTDKKLKDPDEFKLILLQRKACAGQLPENP